MDDPTNPRDRTTDFGDHARDESSALIPRPEEERQAPPRDVDAREGHPDPIETIPLPGHDESNDDKTQAAADIETQIDETLPPPAKGSPTPAGTTPEDDIDVQIDETLPTAEEEMSGEPTTVEDLDDETAFRLDNEDASVEEPAVESGDVFTTLSMDAPETLEDDTLPVNDESVIYRSDTGPLGSAQPDEGTIAEETPLPPAGTTTCPVCGQETDALRFCGHCGAPLTQQRPRSSDATPLGRIQEQARGLVEPLGEWTRPAFVRMTLAAGAVLILLALLANSGGLALMIGAAILPVILIFSFIQRDVFESEPPLILAALGIGGVLTGAVLGWFGAWLVTRNWFEEGVLNYGAAGFGGRFAEAAGSAPFSVWALNGVVLPLLAITASVGVPIALRQSMSLRNEIMDGLTLAGTMAAGISLGSAMVFAAPMLANGGPASDASGWTLTTIGLTIIRPLIWTLSGAMLGAGAWRYMLKPSIGSLLLPAIGGVGAPLLHTFVSIQIAPTGLWSEVIWGVLVVIAVALLFRMVLASAIEHDRRVLGSDNARLICPACHRVTPSGAYCAHCGTALPAATSATA